MTKLEKLRKKLAFVEALLHAGLAPLTAEDIGFLHDWIAELKRDIELEIGFENGEKALKSIPDSPPSGIPKP